MGLTRDDANEQLYRWVSDPSLLRHSQAVALLMEVAAERYGMDEDSPEQWGIAGLLHDADYELWPEQHPDHIVSWLRDHGEPEIAYAVSAHHTKWANPQRAMLDKALLACDEACGFIMAYAKMRPDGLRTMKPTKAIKKLNDKSFAAGVDRGEVFAGAALLDIDLDELFTFMINVLRENETLLGDQQPSSSAGE